MNKLDKLYLLLIIFMLLVLFSLSADSFGQTLSGSGTSGDPYLVYDSLDVLDMNNYAYNGNLYFKQMADISLAAYTDWIPLWAGQATTNYYDGNGYKIKHMNITAWTISTEKYRGFFSRLSTSYNRVSNMVFDSCTIDYNITSYGYNEYTGFVAGDARPAGGMTNILVDSTCVINIQGRPYRLYLGGIVGSGGVVNGVSRVKMNLDFTGFVDQAHIGGVVGLAADIYSCLFQGSIDASNTSASDKYYIGGVAGSISNTGFILASTGSIVETMGGGTSNGIGGLVGRIFGVDEVEGGYSALDTVSSNSGYFGYVLGRQESTPSTTWDVFYSKDQAVRDGSYPSVAVDGGLDTSIWLQTSDWLKNQDTLVGRGWDFTTDWAFVSGLNNGYPIPYDVLNMLLPSVTITSLTDESEPIKAGSQVTLIWTGEGTYDNVTVNGVAVLDTTYNFTIPDTSGQYSVGIVSVDNPTASDSVHLYVYPQGEVVIYYEGFEDYTFVDDDISATNWKYFESSSISYVAIIEDGDAVAGMDYTISRNNYLYGGVGNGSFNSTIRVTDTVQTIAFPGNAAFTYILRYDYVIENVTINGFFAIDSLEGESNYLYSFVLDTLANGIYHFEDTITVTSATDSSVITIYQQAQNGRFSFDNILLTQLAPLDLEITEPEEGDYVSTPFTINWTGLGSYDSVTVNGLEVNDTSYTVTSAPTGWYDIVVRMLEDSLIYDSIRVRVVELGSIELDSAYIFNNEINYVITTGGVDTVLFYIGVDTVDMTYVGTAFLGDSIYTGTKTFANPSGFFASGNLWFKAIEDKDTSSYIPTPTVTSIGNRGGTQVCWTPAVSDPIEVIGQLDLSCGWNPSFVPSMRTSQLYLRNGYAPSQLISLTQCVIGYPCGVINAPRYAFTIVDTLTGDTTTAFYPDVSYYTNTGSTIIYQGRRYYIYSEDIYYDDLVNGRDTIQYIDLDEFYNPPYWSSSQVSMLAPSLALMEYATPIGEVVRYNGTEGLEAAMNDQYLLDSALFIIHEPSSFQASWYFYPESNVPNDQDIAYDVYSNTGAVVDIRNYFRGIHPKILKYGVE